MLNVILVDDEPLVRIAFKSFLDWDAHGFRFVGEFSNGKDAWDQIKSLEADIIVTDIRMPVMDGLQLIREVRADQSDIVIVVLSSYDDFHLVKEAYNYGIYDYILKTEMNPEQLKQLFAKVKEHITDYRIKTNQHVKLQKLVTQNKASLRAAFFKELIWGRSLNDEKLDFEIDQLGLLLKPKNLYMSILQIEDFDILERKYGDDSLQLLLFSMLNIIEEILNEDRIGDVFSNHPGEYVIIFSFNEIPSSKLIKETLWHLHKRIHHVLVQYLNVTVSSGISDVSLRGFRHMIHMYKQASQAVEYKFVKGKSTITFFDEVVTHQMDRLDDKVEKGSHILRGFLENPLEEQLEAMLQQLLITSTTSDPNDFKQIKLIYGVYASVLYDHSLKKQILMQMMEVFEAYYKRLQTYGTLNELNEWLRRILQMICEENNGESYLVKQAKQYIYGNYGEQITLSKVAQSLQVSESHLSRLFSEQTGERFMRFLVKVRIEKAKEYLDTTHLKIYEIAEKVGYTSTEHFSRSFKEVTGKSPKSFMNK
ncbi:response regulator transcription factor [Paenibacillus eucommiae]|uniref:Two-component system response regulator YesN n=1 Tax=Paenibacillus eucommiae TaxID=1355755 RepID=A0ABS4IRC4_9BACL|nr:response regulator [Paenibacillus eucommiae]MBP1990123.1 two-component system response regulator YesN [Paenibacillus eucommiae]